MYKSCRIVRLRARQIKPNLWCFLCNFYSRLTGQLPGGNRMLGKGQWGNVCAPGDWSTATSLFIYISLAPSVANRLSLGKMNPKKARRKRNGPRSQRGTIVDLSRALVSGCVDCLRALSYLNENQYYVCQRFTTEKCPESMWRGGEEKGRMNRGKEEGSSWVLWVTDWSQCLIGLLTI